MNSVFVFCLLISFSVVHCAPYVDVKNDHRPILDVISPDDELVMKEIIIVIINQLNPIATGN